MVPASLPLPPAEGQAALRPTRELEDSFSWITSADQSPAMPTRLVWHFGEQRCHAFLVARRPGGMLLAVPHGFLPEEQLLAAAEDAGSFLGPSLEVEVPVCSVTDGRVLTLTAAVTLVDLRISAALSEAKGLSLAALDLEGEDKELAADIVAFDRLGRWPSGAGLQLAGVQFASEGTGEAAGYSSAFGTPQTSSAEPAGAAPQRDRAALDEPRPPRAPAFQLTPGATGFYDDAVDLFGDEFAEEADPDLAAERVAALEAELVAARADALAAQQETARYRAAARQSPQVQAPEPRAPARRPAQVAPQPASARPARGLQQAVPGAPGAAEFMRGINVAAPLPGRAGGQRSLFLPGAGMATATRASRSATVQASDLRAPATETPAVNRRELARALASPAGEFPQPVGDDADCYAGLEGAELDPALAALLQTQQRSMTALEVQSAALARLLEAKKEETSDGSSTVSDVLGYGSSTEKKKYAVRREELQRALWEAPGQFHRAFARRVQQRLLSAGGGHLYGSEVSAAGVPNLRIYMERFGGWADFAEGAFLWAQNAEALQALWAALAAATADGIDAAWTQADPEPMRELHRAADMLALLLIELDQRRLDLAQRRNWEFAVLLSLREPLPESVFSRVRGVDAASAEGTPLAPPLMLEILRHYVKERHELQTAHEALFGASTARPAPRWQAPGTPALGSDPGPSAVTTEDSTTAPAVPPKGQGKAGPGAAVSAAATAAARRRRGGASAAQPPRAAGLGIFGR